MGDRGLSGTMVATKLRDLYGRRSLFLSPRIGTERQNRRECNTVSIHTCAHYQAEGVQEALPRSAPRKECVAQPLLRVAFLRSSRVLVAEVLAVPKNMKLLAIPLFELYDNAARCVCAALTPRHRRTETLPQLRPATQRHSAPALALQLYLPVTGSDGDACLHSSNGVQ